MFQTTIVGYLGADAEAKNENGNEFITFRVAHTDRWKDANGVQKESTQWIDCIMSGHPNVFDYLKAGTLVYVTGHARLRCYSSAAARSFVAGITISVSVIELLGGSSDAVPKRLYSADGRQHDVQKFFFTDCPGEILTNGRGKEFAVDDNGWVMPMEQAQAQMAQQEQQAQAQAAQQGQQAQNQGAQLSQQTQTQGQESKQSKSKKSTK